MIDDLLQLTTANNKEKTTRICAIADLYLRGKIDVPLNYRQVVLIFNIWYNTLMNNLPQEVKVCLWSYDTNKINLSTPADRFRIILNILNRGTWKALEWLWKNFSEEEIKAAIVKSISTEWNRKSLCFWSHIYGAAPFRKSRFTKSYAPSLGYSR